MTNRYYEVAKCSEEWARYQEPQNNIDIYVNSAAAELLKQDAATVIKQKQCYKKQLFYNCHTKFMYLVLINHGKNLNLCITVDNNGNRKLRGLLLTLINCGFVSPTEWDKRYNSRRSHKHGSFKFDDTALECLLSLERNYGSILNLPDDSTDPRWIYIKHVTGQC